MFSHTHSVFGKIAGVTIELDSAVVAGSYLKINFCAAQVCQSFLGGLHQDTSDTISAVGWCRCDFVYPSPHAVKTGNGRTYDSAVGKTNEKQFRLNAQFSGDQSV